VALRASPPRAQTLPRRHRPPYQAHRRLHPSHALDFTLGEFAMLRSSSPCCPLAEWCPESRIGDFQSWRRHGSRRRGEVWPEHRRPFSLSSPD
jgi:hypothetical protein